MSMIGNYFKLKTLDSFDTIVPKYNPWELKETNKQFYSWTKACNINIMVKNSKLV